MPDAVVLQRLSKTFPTPAQGSVWALRDVTIRVPAGTAWILTGHNGAGKTTLLKILATLILPTSGMAALHGVDVARDPLAARRQLGMAWADDRTLYWRLTGRQNLVFFGTLYGLARLRLRAQISRLAEHFHLDFLDRPVYAYSAGMRQRLNLARSLLPASPILLLDEPARSLDPAAVEALWAWLKRALTNGTTTLIAAQRWEPAGLDETVVRLDRGQLMAAP